MNEIAEYEQSLTDPNRFKIPGRMLKEEKVRKIIAKQLPTLEKKIKTVSTSQVPNNDVIMSSNLCCASFYLLTNGLDLK